MHCWGPVKEFMHLERLQNLIFPFIQIKHGEVSRLYSLIASAEGKENRIIWCK
jgi:hypothetical protein